MKKVTLIVAALLSATSSVAFSASTIAGANANSSSFVTSGSSATNTGIGYSEQVTGAFAGNRSVVRTYRDSNSVAIKTRTDGGNSTYAGSVSTGNALGSGSALSFETGSATGSGAVGTGSHDHDSHNHWYRRNNIHGSVGGYGEVDSSSGVISGSYSTSGNNGFAEQGVVVGATNTSALSIKTRANVDASHNSAKGKISGVVETASAGGSYIAGYGEKSGDAFGVAGGLSAQSGSASGAIRGHVRGNNHSHIGGPTFNQGSNISGSARSEVSSLNIGIGVNNFEGYAYQEAGARQTTAVKAFTKANPSVKIAKTKAVTEGSSYVNGDEFGAGTVWGFGTSDAEAFGGANANAWANQ